MSALVAFAEPEAKPLTPESARQHLAISRSFVAAPHAGRRRGSTFPASYLPSNWRRRFVLPLEALPAQIL